MIETDMFIRTKRLFLRPIWIEDKRLLTIFSDPEKSPPLPDNWSFLRSLSFTKGVLAPQNAIALFLVFLRTSGAGCLVGGAGLFRSNRAETALSTWSFPKYFEWNLKAEVYPAMQQLAEIGLRLPKITNDDTSAFGFVPAAVEPSAHSAAMTTGSRVLLTA